MLTREQKVRFVECIQKGLHEDWLWWLEDTTEENMYGSSYGFMMRIGNWYIYRVDHSGCGDRGYANYLEGSANAIAAVEQEKKEVSDDPNTWVGDPEDVLTIPDQAKNFGDKFTADRIIKEIKEDEQLSLFVEDPHWELPDEYYGSV